jgi:transposase
MSAEPGRKAPYSVDLRHRMIWQKIGMGLTFRGVARYLNVSLGTVHNVLRLFEATGKVDPKHPDRTSTRKLSSNEELIVVGLILDNPGLYLGEICQNIADITGTQISSLEELFS